MKIDIEGSEWYALPKAIKDNSLQFVKQLALEIHLEHTDVNYYKSVYRQLKSLEDYGFRLWSSTPNIYTLQKSSSGFKRFLCYELVYINERFLPNYERKLSYK